MADLGAIAVATNGELVGLKLPIYHRGADLTHMADVSGRYRGTITESGVPVKDVKVLLYYRPTGELVAFTWTDADGFYEFTGLIPTANLYAVVAQDKEGGTQYNDQIKALATPG